MPERLFERKEEPTIYKGKSYTPMSPEEYEAKWRKGVFPMGEGVSGGIRLFQEKEEPFVMHFLKEPPKITESREFKAGQESPEAEERRLQIKQKKQEYVDVLSQVYTSEKDIHRLGTMRLPELDEAYTNYTNWQNEQQQQMITQVGEQLGLTADMVGQIQGAYPPEEVPAKMQLAGIYMTLLKSKHTSATMLKQFNELMFPEAEEEPDMYEKMREYEMYGKLTGEEGQYTPTGLPFEITSELDPTISAFARDMAEGLQGITSVEELDANELLNAVMNNYYGNDEAMIEEAKQMINYTLQKMIGQTIDWTMLE